ncbi:hypothetical protein POX_f08053 [Penicillium oxalicum]|uniref:hypothetical protein n=1 Tax=Penicillium oxalicum TaxID=69781 RepID=UPI0020B747F3|nr:hypothetical protein POX_f08053 [Penicillium oxalicum]KAI2787678.1 hypothetical protein POX_f08053 [Penicillium oxalicum]
MFQLRGHSEPELPFSKEQERDDALSVVASEDDGFLYDGKQQNSFRAFTQAWSIPWLKLAILTTAWITSIAITIYACEWKGKDCEGLSTVFPTEIQSVQPAIKLEKVRFSGTLEFDENSTLISTYWDSDGIRYTGEPSDELDARWHALIHPDGVDLKGDEAGWIQGTTIEKPGGWSIVSVDVFHQLHCLNLLRQALRPDYYTKHDPEPAYTIHIHHCLDHLRQALMCHVDVTPIPVLWAEKENRPLNDFQVEHTCRNFWQVKQWAIAHDARKHKYKGQ